MRDFLLMFYVTEDRTADFSLMKTEGTDQINEDRAAEGGSLYLRLQGQSI